MTRLILTGAACALALSLAAASADSHDDVAPVLDDPVSLRMNIMKNVGAATKIGGQMIKGETEFEPRAAEAALRTIYTGSLGYAAQFPEGSDTGHETEAKANIWTDRAGFEEAITKFVNDSREAVASPPADLDAFKAAFGEVTSNCKDCHEEYRVDKD